MEDADSGQPKAKKKKTEKVIKPRSLSKQLENQLDSVTENPFVFCGYKVSHVIGQNTHSRNIFSVHSFLRLSVTNNMNCRY